MDISAKLVYRGVESFILYDLRGRREGRKMEEMEERNDTDIRINSKKSNFIKWKRHEKLVKEDIY